MGAGAAAGLFFGPIGSFIGAAIGGIGAYFAADKGLSYLSDDDNKILKEITN